MHPVLELDQYQACIMARLRFRYGRTEVPAYPPRPAFIQGNRIVRRRTDAEKEAIDILLKSGFQPADPKFGLTDTFKLSQPDAVWKFVREREQDLPDWEFRETPAFTAFANLTGMVKLGTLVVDDSAPEHWTLHAWFALPDGSQVSCGDLMENAKEHDVFVIPVNGKAAVFRLDTPARLLVGFLSERGLRPRQDQVSLGRYALPALNGILGVHVPPEFPGAEALRELTRPLSPDEVTEFHPVVARLRPYQRIGLAWINRLRKYDFHGILADEMGLGKTIQALAALVRRKLVDKNERPSLVVCPTSLLDNWSREAHRFVPDLRTVVIRGPERAPLIHRLPEMDLGVTSYAMLRRDIQTYRDIPFDYVILDEAHHIKNPQTANARTCKMLQCRHRLILTGTPVENNLSELWSLFDFLLPGMLGPERLYRRNRETPERTAFMAKAIRPFILRRTKEDVAPELPPKVEQTLYCELGPEQRNLYNRYLAEGYRWLAKAREEGWQRTRFHFLAVLTRIRQVCVHPALLPEGTAGPDTPSAKTELLKEIVLEALDSGRRMLVFSQFTTFLRLIRSWLEAENIRYEYLDGATTDRQARVDHFNNDPTVPVFLISLRAGGQGLNLTGADTVVHYDLWWNPMVHDQATDRSHRIGQTKTVNAIRLITRNSVEERILELQDRKRVLVNQLIGGVPKGLGELALEDYEFLLAPPPPEAGRE